MKTVAILPARGGSKRMPRKNILPLQGKPLIAWTIGHCLESRVFNEVIVSTEDDEIARISKSAGARVIERPQDMATDTAHESLAYRHVLETLQGESDTPEIFCGLYPTAALLQPSDLVLGLARMIETGADVVMGVSAYPIHPYKALEETEKGFLKMVYPDQCKRRSQEFPHYVASNGTFYFMRTAPFLAKADYYPEKLAGYELPHERAIDLDTPEDYKLMQYAMARREAGEGKAG